MRAQRSNHLHNRNKQGEFEILPNRTYIDGSKHRVADVAVGDEEDGLDEAEEEQLERVDLADENSKGDENCRGTETSFKHSRNQIVNVKRVPEALICSRTRSLLSLLCSLHPQIC